MTNNGRKLDKRKMNSDEKEHIERMKRLEKSKLLELRDVVGDIRDDVEGDIIRLYQSYASSEGLTLANLAKKPSKYDVDNLKRRIRNMRKLRKLSKSDSDLLQQAEELSRINVSELLNSYTAVNLVKHGDSLTKAMYLILYQVAKAELKHSLKSFGGVKGATSKLNSEKSNTASKSSLHESLKRTFYITTFDVRSAIKVSVTQSESPKDFFKQAKKRFSKVFDTMTSNLVRTAKTETSKLTNNVRTKFYKGCGYESYRIANEAGACKICQRHASAVYPLNEAEFGRTLPPLHPNCKCSTTPVTKPNDWYDNGNVSQATDDVAEFAERLRNEFEQ